MILTWFRDWRTCHPLKDLGAPLAKAASINKMQAKDFLKELTDENKVRVEKTWECKLVLKLVLGRGEG
jgi:hypothetical protein